MKKRTSPIECRDAALALSFLCLLVWLFTGHAAFIYGAMAVLLAVMVYPKIMTYPAMLWFGLAHALSLVFSKLLLGAVFFLIVVPVAAIRRLLGKDPMRMKNWKAGNESAFVTRGHLFSKADLDRQF